MIHLVVGLVADLVIALLVDLVVDSVSDLVVGLVEELVLDLVVRSVHRHSANLLVVDLKVHSLWLALLGYRAQLCKACSA